jgi:peptidyl-dipeptidase Dcp
MSNPILRESTLVYELPPFELIDDTHYREAFDAGMREQMEEIKAITSNPQPPTFENTIQALERSGAILTRVSNIFYNKSSSDTNPTIDEIESDYAPKLAAHEDSIWLDAALFSRIETLYQSRQSLNLNSDDNWLLELYYKDFLHAGAKLTGERRERLKAINEELSSLETQFAKNVLTDSNELAVIVTDVSELDGLTDAQISAAASAAQARGMEGTWLITMVNFTGHPLLASLKNRGLRERIMKASLMKGDQNNANDTKQIARKMAYLRAERARLFNRKNHAEYVTSMQTSGSPENVHTMLRTIAPSALRNAKKEGQDLQAQIDREGGGFELASWDWDYYTEKVRREKYDIDSASLKPYFELDRVLRDGVFFAAGKLFGLTFVERPDLVGYHPEVRVFEVFNEDGSPLALYLGDYFTRDSKRGGAWMNSLVSQSRLLGKKPVVVNNMNIPKPADGQPALLTFSETTTLFHEFGHALHGMLSNVEYPRTSGTRVHRDFVEFPSQVNEMWILWPDIVTNYTRHIESGESLPQSVIDRINAAETFNEGHATTSYLAAAVIDLAWHELEMGQEVSDVSAFERDALARYGLEYEPVPTRYRTTYFSHIFAGGYSSGYYGYIWSEVLDADAVQWFKESGGLTRKNGDHFRNQLLSRGGSLDSMEMYRRFRGRDAVIEPLLKRRGLL